MIYFHARQESIIAFWKPHLEFFTLHMVTCWKYGITVTGFIETATLPFPPLLAHKEYFKMFITAALRERRVQKAIQAILNSSNENATDPQSLQEVPHSEELFHR